MKRRTAQLGAMVLCAVALVAVAAVPASAKVPGGHGLIFFSPVICDHDLGLVDLFGPPAPQGTSGYLIADEETGLHAIATRFELTVDGDLVFEQNFGKKAGLTTLTCTATFDGPEGLAVFTLTAAVVPPG